MEDTNLLWVPHLQDFSDRNHILDLGHIIAGKSSKYDCHFLFLHESVNEKH